ncbi:MAG: CPXCG motif-containing cysteine-rich protein [Gammaproteobacteria bacterium]
MKERFIQCPWCGERISMLLDLSVEEQEYVEDCEVCCSPILVRYRVRGGRVAGFQAARS